MQISQDSGSQTASLTVAELHQQIRELTESTRAAKQQVTELLREDQETRILLRKARTDLSNATINNAVLRTANNELTGRVEYLRKCLHGEEQPAKESS